VIAADCSAFSTPSFHQLFLGQGHPLVLGCPKLDDPISQTDRLTGILVANPGIREIWVPIMEVPCCRGLTLAVSRALANSGRKDSVRVRTFVVGRDGTVGEELPRDR
jgi:hypothetical protein